MAPVSTYTVHAKRAGKYWELHIDGVGVTQSRTLGADADEMVRSYVATMKDVAPDAVDYTLKPKVDADIDAEAAAARKAAKEAEEAVTRSAARNRAAARRLSEAGLSGRDVAVVLGVSPQRVSQLLTEKTFGRLETIKKAGKGTQRKNAASRSRKRSSA
jgi:hypothetical protein